jgi:hypothetical protein
VAQFDPDFPSLVTSALATPAPRSVLSKAGINSALILALAWLSWLSVPAAAELPKEDKLKAAYLLNFTRFIEWPNRGTVDEPAVIRVCVDSSEEFLRFLVELVGDRRVGRLRHPVNVSSLDGADNCDLIFLQDARDEITLNLPEAIVVADSADAVLSVAAIVFYTEDRKLRFEVDLQKIRSLDVSVSSELLKLARIRS